MSPTSPSAALRRRTVLEALPALLAAAPGAARAQADTPAAPRVALLVGNRDYPEPDDLPPTHKNVGDLHQALADRGFSVTDALDVDAARTRQAIDQFTASVKAGPPETISFFYFTGHGLQLDAESLLVGAGTSPKAKADVLGRSSINVIKDVVQRLPSRPEGLNIAVIDACRTNLRAAVQAGDGLNQIEVPPGFLVAFSTGAGKPAIAPNSDKANTFYTASLVKLMKTADDEASWSDFFSLVRLDVLETMRKHPVEAVRALAQDSFIAKDVRRALSIARPRPADAAPPPPPPRAPDDLEDWAAVDSAIWPPDVAQRADLYLQRHPTGRRATAALVAREGAKEAAKVLRLTEVHLYRTAFTLADDAAPELRADLHKCARGDKDAAARVARRHADSGAQQGRYEGWLQYATYLGNGIAAYELALHYRRTGQPLLAARYEALARELGYTPPPTLDHYRK